MIEPQGQMFEKFLLNEEMVTRSFDNHNSRKKFGECQAIGNPALSAMDGTTFPFYAPHVESCVNVYLLWVGLSRLSIHRR